MSKTIIAIGLLALAGPYSISAAVSVEAVDPHQRAREMISPSTFPQGPSGAMGRPAAALERLDPHTRAANLVSHGQFPPVTANPEAVSFGAAGQPDPHRRAQMIMGHGG